MTLEDVYDPATTGDARFRGRAHQGGHHQSFADVFGRTKTARENDGSGAVAGAAGQIQIDTSGKFDDATYVSPKTVAANAHTVQWDPKINERILEHGGDTGGPFVIGETVTGADSAAAAVVTGVGTLILQVDTIAGTFETGEQIDGGGSSASALLTHPTADAGDDPIIDQRRFIYLVFRDYDGVPLVDTTPVLYTYTARGVNAGS